MKRPAVYMVANKRNGTIYTGVTSNLIQRTYQHKQGAVDGFSKRYHCNALVFYEFFEQMDLAILREKEIKKGSREKKLQLIEDMNPMWLDLYEDII